MDIRLVVLGAITGFGQRIGKFGQIYSSRQREHVRYNFNRLGPVTLKAARRKKMIKGINFDVCDEFCY
jgi:hypothetical protein